MRWDRERRVEGSFGVSWLLQIQLDLEYWTKRDLSPNILLDLEHWTKRVSWLLDPTSLLLGVSLFTDIVPVLIEIFSCCMLLQVLHLKTLTSLWVLVKQLILRVTSQRKIGEVN
jgi:hypothetical protein